jgi:CBS domain-containing protein
MPSLFELIQDKAPALKLGAHQMVFTAARLMADAKLGAVLVSDSYEGVNGIFTESDCMRKVTARGLDPATTPLRMVMKPIACYARFDQSVEDCLHLMTENSLHHLPVLDADRRVMGILSIDDLLKGGFSEQGFFIN